MRTLSIVIFICFSMTSQVQAQWIHWGYTFGLDLYQRQTMPASEIDPFGGEATGSAILNINVGPKIWMGNENFSFSLEGQASYAPLAFDLGNYRGMGVLSFPIIASLNFNGLSTVGKSFGTGFTIGGGVQYTNADLYFLSDEYKAVEETNRISYFPAYFGQVGFGGGGTGLAPYLYLRYGRGEEGANIFHLGINVNINRTAISNLKNVSSEE